MSISGAQFAALMPSHSGGDGAHTGISTGTSSPFRGARNPAPLAGGAMSTSDQMFAFRPELGHPQPWSRTLMGSWSWKNPIEPLHSSMDRD